MGALHDSLREASAALTRHDKPASIAALNTAERLATDHRTRHLIRAAECSTDIGNWSTAHAYLQQAQHLIAADVGF